MNAYLRWALIIIGAPIWIPLLTVTLIGFGAILGIAAITDITGAVIDNKPINWRSVKGLL